MKKLIVLTMMLLCGMTSAIAQKPAEMKFEKASHDFGTFTENEAIQSYTFTFQNVGESPLIINQAMASCGCTDPEYPKTPIQPGEKGQVKVTYNGVGKSFGHFRKFFWEFFIYFFRLYVSGHIYKVGTAILTGGE